MKNVLYSKIIGCLAGGIIGDAMGAPVENFTYQMIEEKYGVVNDFEGAGTDDSAIKMILIDAIVNNDGYVTADEFAASFLKLRGQYERLFYIPVRNMLAKITSDVVAPTYAGMGNMQSSSSAMSISPMGIINAGNPRRAAGETYDVAGLIHAGETTFCRDAACSMAAAVAEAMGVGATVESVVEAAYKYIHPKSSEVMKNRIIEILDYAKECGDYKKFREWFYAGKRMKETCDSRETVPVALAMFYFGKGDPEKTIIYAVNFGRDADTIATMAGALAGAFAGVEAIKPEWFEKLQKNNDQRPLADSLYDVVMKRVENERALCRMIDEMTVEN